MEETFQGRSEKEVSREETKWPDKWENSDKAGKSRKAWRKLWWALYVCSWKTFWENEVCGHGKGFTGMPYPTCNRTVSFWREGLTAFGSLWASYRIKTTRIQYVYWLHLQKCEKLVSMTTSAAKSGWRGSRLSISWMRKEGKCISNLLGCCDNKISDKPTEKWGFILAGSLRVQPIMEGQSRGQELEAARHTASGLSKQSGESLCSAIFSFLSVQPPIP